MGFIDKVLGLANKAKFFGIAHTPEICMVVGTLELIGTVVSACKATVKFQEDLKELNENLELLKQIKEEQEEGTAEGARASLDVSATRKGAYIDIVKKGAVTYAPTLLLGAATAATYFIGYRVLNVRIAAASALASKLMVEKRTTDEWVQNRYGDDALRELRHAREGKPTLETHKDEETGEIVVDKVEYPKNARESFTLIFDETCDGFSDLHEENMFYLSQKEAYCNYRLDRDGDATFNDRAKDIVGKNPDKLIKQGQTWGWHKYASDEEAAKHGADNKIVFSYPDEVPLENQRSVKAHPIKIMFNVDPNPIIGCMGFRDLKGVQMA